MQLRQGVHGNIHLQRAWNKYGESAFLFEVIGVCDKEFLLEAEQFWIDALNVYKTGFNRCPIARNSSGIKRSEETLEKMRKMTNYQKANAAWRGSKHSEETREIIRKKRAQQVMTPWSEERKKKHKELMAVVNKRVHGGKPTQSKYFNIVAENTVERIVFKDTFSAKEHFGFKNTLGITRVLRGERKMYKGYRWYVEMP